MNDICPHCNKENQGFEIRMQVAGSAIVTYTAVGEHDETNLDKMYWKNDPKTVRCANCGKVRRDVFYNGKQIVHRIKL